jgi:Transposase DDE domain group 1
MMVSANGTGLVSQAGAVLLVQAMRVTGLDRGLRAALVRWRALRAVHDPGTIVADLAVAVALGGDPLADIAVLRAQPEDVITVRYHLFWPSPFVRPAQRHRVNTLPWLHA